MPLVLGIRYPLAALRRPSGPALALLERSTITMRVRPSDCDINLHINNGRYLSLMDIGRINHARQCRLMPVFRRTGWRVVAGGATIRFRRELRLGTCYRLHTRCVGWDEDWSYWEQVFERLDGALAARAYVKAAVLDRDGARVPSAHLMQELGESPESPGLPEGLLAWQRSDHG